MRPTLTIARRGTPRAGVKPYSVSQRRRYLPALSPEASRLPRLSIQPILRLRLLFRGTNRTV